MPRYNMKKDDDIDMDVLWDTIVDDIPQLIEELKKIQI